MSYLGKDLLQIMQIAKNYNKYIVNLIIKSAGKQNIETKKILDFGSGYGFFANLVRKQGAKNIQCVEIDEELKNHCKSLDFEVFSDLDKVEDNQFDFIYTLNVLEHVEDDEKALIELKNKLKRDGKIFIYVPACQILYSTFDKKIGHHRRYCKNKLPKMLEDIGFTLNYVKYADSVGFLLALLYRILRIEDGKITPAQMKIFDTLLFPISRLLDKITLGKLFGKNLIIEAELK